MAPSETPGIQPPVRRRRFTLVAVPAALLLCLALAACFPGCASPAASSQPLRLHPTNTRCFVDGAGRAVYLTGSHTWGQCGDGFDFEAYLDFLERYHHNFIRLWSGDYSLAASPGHYLRTGPGTALDGLPRVDLSQPNPAYFERLRACADAARKRGIYVAVTFFPLDSAKRKTDRDASPCFGPYNVQALDGDFDGDGFLSEAFDLSIPELTAHQERFARQLIDALSDLDNVLYEIGNEGDVRSAAWQCHFVRFIKAYEAGKPLQHLVGMTAMLDWPTHTEGSSEVLLASPADWVSVSGEAYRTDVSEADGSKVSILDTDHLSLVKPDWVWKCFTRGHHPILMDWYEHTSLPMRGTRRPSRRRCGGPWVRRFVSRRGWISPR